MCERSFWTMRPESYPFICCVIATEKVVLPIIIYKIFDIGIYVFMSLVYVFLNVETDISATEVDLCIFEDVHY